MFMHVVPGDPYQYVGPPSRPFFAEWQFVILHVLLAVTGFSSFLAVVLVSVSKVTWFFLPFYDRSFDDKVRLSSL